MCPLIFVLAVVGQDVTGPVFLDVSVDPIYIDCRESDQVVMVYAELSDDLSGIRDHSGFTVGFRGPSGGYNSQTMSDSNRISGDGMHGWYAEPLVFGQYSELGIWRMDFLGATDNLGNRSRLEGDEIPFDVYVINGPLPIPEPSTIVLLAVCLAVAAVRWRRS